VHLLRARSFFCACVHPSFLAVSILAIGTVALDHIETPFAAQRNVLGGSATFITLAARYFCPDVHLCASVGADFPEAYITLLRESGVDLSGLEVDPNGETFSWSGRYAYDMNSRDTLETRLGVLATFQPRVPEPCRDADIVCLGNLEPGIQKQVIEQARSPRLTVLDTMNYWIEHTPERLRETLSIVDCLIVNDAEARELAGTPSLVRAARLIREMGPRILVIKKGEHGALLFTDEGAFAAPAFPLEEVYDPTGAGDTFMGGFAGYLAGQTEISEGALRRAVVYGTVLASFCVEQFGPARLFTLTPAEIRTRLQAFEQVCRVPEAAEIEVAMA